MHLSLTRFGPRTLAAFLTALLLATLAACGGSGAGAGGGGDLADTQATSLTLLSDQTALESDGTASATLTAIVKDGSNRSISAQDVSFSTTDAGAILQIVSSRTDAAGKATATLTTSDPRARTITVRATVQGATGSISTTRDIQVAGTSLSIGGSQTVPFGATSSYTVSVRDSSSNPIPGINVAMTSAAGNSVSPATATSNSQGQTTFTVTGTNAGTDTLTASALGVSTTRAINVSGTQLEFLSPAASAELPVATNQNVRVRLRVNGANVVGQTVSFSATRGALTPTSAVTDSNGEALVQINAPTAGFASINATESGGASTTQAVEFVATTASKLALQANPTVVGVNLTPSGTNAAQLIAVVRDAADNPVKNKRVNFSSVNDPSNGRIEPGFAITDSSGTATTSFIPGANTTGPEGVVLRATIEGTAISTTTTLTASRQELSVIIGTGNTIEAPDNTTYRMPWTALVTDSSGNPVVNATVTAQLEPLGFRTGRWTTGGGGGGAAWVLSPNAECASEDTNRNGRLDAGEDLTSGDVGTIGRLDPGQVAAAVVTSANAKTDTFGEAKITINYPKEYGQWVKYRMRVTISAPAGTEGVAVSEFWLPILASDVSDTGVAPPGATSPIGPFKEGTACTPL